MRTKLRASDCAPQETDFLSVLFALADRRTQVRFPTPGAKASDSQGRTTTRH